MSVNVFGWWLAHCLVYHNGRSNCGNCCSGTADWSLVRIHDLENIVSVVGETSLRLLLDVARLQAGWVAGWFRVGASIGMSWLEAVLACLVLGSWTENGAGIGPGFEAKLPVRVTTCKHRNWLCQIRDLVSEVRMDTLHLIIGSADQRASRQIGAATNADGSALSATRTRATSGA